VVRRRYFFALTLLMYPANFPALGREPFLSLRRVPLRGLTLFSCLDARKEAKENQGIRDASQVFRDFQRILMYPADFPALGRGPFLSLMKEKRQKKIKPSRMAFSPRVREREGTKMDA